MKSSLFVSLCAAASLAGCNPAERQIVGLDDSPVTVFEAEAAPEITQPAMLYAEFLENITTEKHAADASPRALLHRYVNTDMPAYWDETTWDFNGMSRVPGEGEIACGYFVTTVLLDLGFPLAHVRLAQDPSSVMINELTTNIKKYTSIDKLLAHIEAQPEPGVYIVGLDFHTGFITAADGEINFVHSNYIGREGVVVEPARTSAALNASGFYMIGSLTENTEMMMIWRAQ